MIIRALPVSLAPVSSLSVIKSTTSTVASTAPTTALAPVTTAVPIEMKPAIHDLAVDIVAVRAPISPISLATPIRAALPEFGKIITIPPIKAIIPPIIHSFLISDPVNPMDSYRIEPVVREQGNFQPFSDLTGLSNQRPAIIAMTEFKPIVRERFNQYKSRDVEMTKAGKFFNDQIRVRHLMYENMARIIREMFAKEPTSANELKNALNDFGKDFTDSTGSVAELILAMNEMQSLRESFAVDRTTRHSSNNVFKDDVKTMAMMEPAPPTPVHVSLEELFTDTFKFKTKAFKEFSHSKIVFQMMYELQHFVKNHSYDLVKTDTSAHSNDATAGVVVKNYGVTPKFNLAFMERFSGIDISASALAPLYLSSQTSTIIRRIDNAFKAIITELPADNVDRITLLSHLISREYRTSQALGNKDFAKRLQTYGINPTDGNIIDQLVGDIPDRISDVISNDNKNALTNTVQFSNDNVAVLPFEQRYIESENGVYTPGAAYLIDSILDSTDGKFDTTRLSSYLGTMSTSLRALNDIMVSTFMVADMKHTPMSMNRSDRFFIRMVYEYMSATFGNRGIDLSTGEAIGVQGDVITALMSLARTDKTLRTLLFLHMVTPDISPEPKLDNALGRAAAASLEIFFQTDITNKIVERVAALLKVKKVSSAAFDSFRKATIETVSSGFTQKTAATAKAISGLTTVTTSERITGDEEIRAALTSVQYRAMQQVLSNIVLDITRVSGFSSEGKTRASKVPTMVMQMLSYELMLSIASRFTFASLRLSGNKLVVDSNVSKAFTFKMLMDKLVVSSNLQRSLTRDLASEVEAFDPQLRTIAAKLDNEETHVRRIHTLVNATFQRVTNRGQTVLGRFRKGNGKNTLVFERLARYVPKDKIPFIDSMQATLMHHRVAEIYRHVMTSGPTSGNPPDFLKFLDASILSPGATRALREMMSFAKFTERQAENMQIMTVGIPAGFSKQLQEKVQLRSGLGKVSFESKQKDIIKIHVYKRDLEFPELVFKRQTRLFELSRFVSPDFSFHETAKFDSPANLIESVRTFDYGVDVGTNGVESLFGETGYSSDIFQSKQYDFLTVMERREIIMNLTISTLLQQYIRVLTGVNIDEQSFLIGSDGVPTSKPINNARVKTLVDSHIKTVAGLKTYDSSKDTLDEASLKQTQKDKLIHDLKHISALASSRTLYSDFDYEAAIAFMPKTFERVFHIPVDPDDFEIDVAASSRYPAGDSALKQYISLGKVVQTGTQRDSSGVEHAIYKLSERNRKRGTTTLEQFFVTIETALGTEV